MALERLFVFTGKGGVGKTSLSLSFAKHLKNQNKKVLYNSFDQETNNDVCNSLEIDHLDLTLERSAAIYIGNKLGSETIAKWVMKTPFFNSLFHMIPGLGHMIMFGHILDMLDKDPELRIVIDSPSSGHALTMFESSFNFKEMFMSGLLVKDIEKMHRLISLENFIKVIILALPNPMAITEANEVQSHLEKLGIENAQIIVNDSLSTNEYVVDSNREKLPGFLAEKISLEEKVLEENSEYIKGIFPHVESLNLEETASKLTPFMEQF